MIKLRVMQYPGPITYLGISLRIILTKWEVGQMTKQGKSTLNQVGEKGQRQKW
jgi:hypothetical protein